MEKRDMTNISLCLNHYSDIFSDFDPRHYSHRALSVDFLDEAKRAVRDTTSGGIELRLQMNRKKRNLKDESVIKRRLRHHFGRHSDMLRKERRGIRNKGIGFVAFGILVMLLTTSLIFMFGEREIYLTFLIVMLEPAGWFLFWEGLNIAMFESKKSTPDLKFYEKMEKCMISFAS